MSSCADHPARAGFGDGERGRALARSAARPPLHRLVAFARRRAAPSRSRIASQTRREPRLRLLRRRRARDRAQVLSGNAVRKPSIDVAVARHVAQLLVEVRLADAEGAQQRRAQPASFPPRAPRRDPRQHLLVHHLRQLARHAGQAEERDACRPSRGTSSMQPGAVPIGLSSTSAPAGNHACFALIAAISRPKRAKKRADRGERRLVQHELAPERLREHLDREVVARRAEPARDQHDRRARPRARRNASVMSARVVAHDDVEARLDVEREQALARGTTCSSR